MDEFVTAGNQSFSTTVYDDNASQSDAGDNRYFICYIKNQAVKLRMAAILEKAWNFNIKNNLANLVETLQDECPVAGLDISGTEHGIRFLDQLDD